MRPAHLPACRHVLFDLDGTLLHTSPDLAAAASLALAESALPDIDASLIETFVGKGIDTLIRRCLAHHGRPQEGAEFERLRVAYMRHYEAVNGRNASLYPGVIEGLEAMHAMGLKLGVCTNKTERFTLPLLERCNLAAYFSVVVSGDTTARKKPAPDMIEHAAKSWGTTVSTMLMIGDSGNDSAAARAAGCPVWLVPYGYNEGQPVQALDCDGFVDDLAQAAAVLGAMSGG